MLDGRIDTQGTIKNLRAQGVLDDITFNSALAIEESDVSEPVNASKEDKTSDGALKPIKDRKKVRQLIQDEHRETGAVKVCQLSSSHVV